LERIIKTGSAHYYHQLRRILQKLIEKGRYKPGDLLPPEQRLCTEFGVSRITVRKALDLLVQDGFLYRERGRGTFITRPPLKQPAQIMSFTEELRKLGLKPGTKVLKAEIITGEKKISRNLSLSDAEETVMIKRLRLADGQPLGIETSFLPHRLFPGILSEDLSASMTKISRKKYHLMLARATQRVKAVAISKEEAALLRLKVGSPALYIERISFLGNNRPAEYLEAVYCSERYQLTMELKKE